MEMKVVPHRLLEVQRHRESQPETPQGAAQWSAPGTDGDIDQKAKQTSVAGADAGPRTLCVQRAGVGGISSNKIF